MSGGLPIKFRGGIDPETMKFEGDVEATGDYEIAGGGMCCFKVEKGRKRASFKMRGKKAAKKRSVKKAKASPPPPPPPPRAAQVANGVLSEDEAVEPRAEVYIYDTLALNHHGRVGHPQVVGVEGRRAHRHVKGRLSSLPGLPSPLRVKPALESSKRHRAMRKSTGATTQFQVWISAVER